MCGDYKEFLHSTLKNRVDQETYQMFNIVLELIITEICGAPYTISLSQKANEIAITINHKDKAIKDSIIDIINDQVDHLTYLHRSKTSHTLKLREKL